MKIRNYLMTLPLLSLTFLLFQCESKLELPESDVEEQVQFRRGECSDNGLVVAHFDGESYSLTLSDDEYAEMFQILTESGLGMSGEMESVYVDPGEGEETLTYLKFTGSVNNGASVKMGISLEECVSSTRLVRLVRNIKPVSMFICYNESCSGQCEEVYTSGLVLECNCRFSGVCEFKNPDIIWTN